MKKGTRALKQLEIDNNFSDGYATSIFSHHLAHGQGLHKSSCGG